MTGELKAVPAYAVSEYLSKWSPYSEVPSHKAKKLLDEKQQTIFNVNEPENQYVKLQRQNSSEQVIHFVFFYN